MAPNDSIVKENGIETENGVANLKDLSPNVEDALLNEMLLLEREIQNTDVAKLKAAEKTVANTNVINAIFKILMQMMPQVKEIRNSVKELRDFQSEVSEQINVLKTENDALKNRILELEIKNSSRSLIIKKNKD